jgi:hypothetical protein
MGEFFPLFHQLTEHLGVRDDRGRVTRQAFEQLDIFFIELAAIPLVVDSEDADGDSEGS